MQNSLAKDIDTGRGKQLMLTIQIQCIGWVLQIVSDCLEHCVEKDSETSTVLIVKGAIINLPHLSVCGISGDLTESYRERQNEVRAIKRVNICHQSQSLGNITGLQL